MEQYESLPAGKEERETIAVYDEETDTWSIYSNVRKHITKLSKIFDDEDMTKVGMHDGRVIEVTIDNIEHSQVSFRNKKKPMSAEQKEKLAQQLKNARESKD